MLHVAIQKKLRTKTVFFMGLACFFLLFAIPLITADNRDLANLNQLNKAVREVIHNQKIPVIPEVFNCLTSSHSRYYVDGSVAASGDGTSWATAFKTIQEAVTAAVNSSEIWVKAGTYLVNSDPNSNPKGITIDKVVYIFGGFKGQEKSLSERNWDKNKTILDAEQKGRSFFITKDAYLDGFTMTNGLVRDGDELTGGAIKITESSPVLKHCVFKANKATYGGGAIYIANGSPYLQDCFFVNNFSIGGIWGGGAIYTESSYPGLVDCTFSRNITDGEGGALYGLANMARCLFEYNEALCGGGAISISIQSINSTQPEHVLCIQQSTFIGNSTGYSGGAVYGMGNIIGCRFDKNTSSDGGGAIHVTGNTNYTDKKTIITNCVFTNNVYTNNSGYNYGGGAICTSENADTYVINSIFVKNQAGDHLPTHGAAYANSGNSYILNCTFWGNTVLIDSPVPQIHDIGKGGTIYNKTGHSLTLVKSILWNNDGGPGEISGEPAAVFYCDVDQEDLANINHNMRSDPLFIAPLTGNFHLQPNSPCKDAGSNLDTGSIPPYDFEGVKRHHFY